MTGLSPKPPRGDALFQQRFQRALRDGALIGDARALALREMGIDFAEETATDLSIRVLTTLADLGQAEIAVVAANAGLSYYVARKYLMDAVDAGILKRDTTHLTHIFYFPQPV